MKTQLCYFSEYTWILYIFVSVIACASCTGQKKDTTMSATDEKKEAMVKLQIEARGVKDENVLKAMRKVDRHRFVPEDYRKYAYDDCPLPIGEGQTISQPYIVALMTEILELDSTKKVLEIGTGSGYQAAVLAEICDSVFTIEIVENLADRTQKLFDELGYINIYLKKGDGYRGWEEHAAFDAIIVTCAPTHIPKPLQDQLAEGGKMIIPVGDFAQELVLLTKKNNKVRQKDIVPVRFVPMMRPDGNKY